MSLYRYAAQLVRVIDGDTVVLDIDLGLRVWARGQRLRLDGINCPELATDAGKAAQAATVGWFAARPGVVWISTSKATDGGDQVEKYGRWLATVWPDATYAGVSLNAWLVDSGHAVPFMV